MMDSRQIRRSWGAGWSWNSSLRDYVWGVIIVAFGLLTVIGMFFLFGG